MRSRRWGEGGLGKEGKSQGRGKLRLEPQQDFPLQLRVAEGGAVTDLFR